MEKNETLERFLQIDASALQQIREKLGRPDASNRYIFTYVVTRELDYVIQLLREAGAFPAPEKRAIPRTIDATTWKRLENASSHVALAPAELLRACLIRVANSTIPKDVDLLDQVLRCLAAHRQRVSYAALARLLGKNPRTLMAGREKTSNYSWVVSSRTGKPSGYGPEECAPDLMASPSPIVDTAILRAWLEERLPAPVLELLRSP